MNDDERRLHDWLDEELDRMAIGGDRPVDPRRVFASETDRALSETAAEMRRIDQRQSVEPSAAFLNNLENHLMPSNSAGRSWSDPVNASRTEAMNAPGRQFRPQRWLSRGLAMSNFAAFALVLALIAASAGAFFTLRGGNSPEPESHGYAAATGNPATPEVMVQNREPLVVEPNANWTWTMPEGTLSAEYGSVLIRNGHAYRQLTYDGTSENIYFNGIQAIDTATGTIAWEHMTPWIYRTFAVDDVGIYTATVPNTVVALDPATGDEHWSNSFSGSVISLTVNEGRIFVWTTTHELHALDAASGDALWSTSVESTTNFEFAGDGTALAFAGVQATPAGVTTMTADGMIVVFDPATGDQRWAQPGFDARRTVTVISGDTLLAVTSPETGAMTADEVVDREGTAFSLTSGAMIWQISVAGPISTFVSAGATGMFSILANDVETTGSLVERATPKVDFEADGSNDIWSDVESKNVWGADGPSGAEFVFGIDAETGQVSWQRSAGGPGFAGLYASYDDPDVIWALTYGNQIVPLQGESGLILGEPITFENILRGIAIGSAEEGFVAELNAGGLVGFGQTTGS